MNPWALVILGIGVLMIIMGVKGSYGNVVTALTGHKYNPPSAAASIGSQPLGQVGTAGPALRTPRTVLA